MSFASLPPIVARELTAHARSRRWAWGRAIFAAAPLVIVVAAAATAWDGPGTRLSGEQIGHAMRLAFRRIVGLHMIAALIVPRYAALAIAGEKDRRTLDFLLATRLGNAEIVLSKLAASLIAGLSPIAAAFPLMLLMIPLGGIDPWLVALTYASVATMSLFLASLAIFVSSAARDGRRAASSTSGLAMLWLSGPFMLAQMLPRFGLRLPEFALPVNALLIASSPMGILGKLMAGPTLPSLIDAVGWMCGLQILGSVLVLVPAILRLRSAYRVNTGGDGLGFRTIAWRMRPRPAVGDDPILWRERYTLRARGLTRLVNNVIWLALGGAIVFSAAYYARPALAEVWAHGYASGPSTDAKPEFNLMVGLFMPASSGPIDQARIDLNTYLRILSLGISLFLGIIAMSFAMESITVEGDLAEPDRHPAHRPRDPEVEDRRDALADARRPAAAGRALGGRHDRRRAAPAGCRCRGARAVRVALVFPGDRGADRDSHEGGRTREWLRGGARRAPALDGGAAFPVAVRHANGVPRGRVASVHPGPLADLVARGPHRDPLCRVPAAPLDRPPHGRRRHPGHRHLRDRDGAPRAARLHHLAVRHCPLRPAGGATVASAGDGAPRASEPS